MVPRTADQSASRHDVAERGSGRLVFGGSSRQDGTTGAIEAGAAQKGGDGNGGAQDNTDRSGTRIGPLGRCARGRRRSGAAGGRLARRGDRHDARNGRAVQSAPQR
ncbi:MAG TPA: hypothetical protein VND64_17145 [Pirellulales bacterium]|nr:hypothetical protein [Pirellulales bacterium]